MTPDLLALCRAYHLSILNPDLWDVSRYQCVNCWSDCMGFSHYVSESSSAFRLQIVVVWLQGSRLKYASVKILKLQAGHEILLQQRLLLSTPPFDSKRILRWLMVQHSLTYWFKHATVEIVFLLINYKSRTPRCRPLYPPPFSAQMFFQWRFMALAVTVKLAWHRQSITTIKVLSN